MQRVQGGCAIGYLSATWPEGELLRRFPKRMYALALQKVVFLKEVQIGDSMTLTLRGIKQQFFLSLALALCVLASGNEAAARAIVTLNSPSNGATVTLPGSVVISVTGEVDTPEYLTVVGFYRDSTLLSQQSISGQTGTWTYTDTNPAAGSHVYKAFVSSRLGSTNYTVNSATATVTVTAANQPPTVNMAGPANGTTFNVLYGTTFTATASDPDSGDSISSVQYFVNGNQVGSATASPYSFTWTGMGAGSYSVYARATDTHSASTNSAAINVVGVGPVTGDVWGTGPGGDGQQYLNGWACDIRVEAPVQVYLYRNGAYPTGTYVGTYNANAAGYSDLATACQTSNGNRVFSIPIGALTATYPGQALYVHIVSSSGGYNNLAGHSGTYTVPANDPPAVAVTAPANSATFLKGSNITLQASASDFWGGSISKVEFYNGATLLGQAALVGSTYSWTWSNVQVGTYAVTAKAYDNLNATTTSAAVNITVNLGTPPTVSITAPANGASILRGTAIALTANAAATNSGGSLTGVSFYDGATLLGAGTASGSTYSFSWSGATAGSHSLTAKATDNLGNITTSPTVTISVTNGASPAVSLTGPANGALYAPGASLTLTATAADSDGTVSSVQFYDGASLIGTGTLANGVYSYSWAAPSTGGHTITARATDNLGNVTTSGAANIQLVVPVQITPPNLAGGIAGSAAGSASVSQTGAATYAVSIPMPPGTAGMVPSIALTYSSQAYTGPLGLGWDIAGLSRITRCGKTIAQDGIRTAVSLTVTDQFCLDGQRLILLTGTHGATAEYRTEIDSFSRVQSFGSNTAKGPDYWTVATKAGQILTFGNTADSNIEAQGSSPTVVLTWALNKVSDQRGNYYTVLYSKDSTNGEFLPSRINYTGNAGTSPVLTPYNAVSFVYETRPDPSVTYVHGAKISNLRRLKNLQTLVNTASDGTGGTLVRDLRIAYTTNPDSGRSLVSTVTDCDTSGNCLPATQFTWSQMNASDKTMEAAGSGTWAGPAITISNDLSLGTPGDQVRSQILMGDFDGDGKTDLVRSDGSGNWNVCLSNGAGFTCQTWTGPAIESYKVLYGDFDGDGKTDIAVPPATVNGSAAWTICYSTGTSFDCRTQSFFAVGSGLNFYLVGDFNGAGRDSIAEGGWGTDMLCNYVDRAQPFNCVSYPGVTNVLPANDDGPRYYQRSGDFNGDGRIDFLTWIAPGANGSGSTLPGTWSVFTASPTGITNDVTGSASTIQRGYLGPARPGYSIVNEHNLDRYDSYGDIVATAGGQSPNVMERCFSTGTTLTCTAVTGITAADLGYINGDFDGDGRPDVMSYDSSRSVYRVCQITDAPTLGYGPCSDWTGSSPTNIAMLAGDFNGDGRPDLAFYDQTSGQWTIKLASSVRANLLSNVTDGNGAQTQFTYSNLQSASVYTRDTGANAATYPQRDVQTPMVVVSEMRSDNGLSGWFTQDFSYGGLKIDLSGRGMLGFRWMNSVDQISHVTSHAESKQTFPYIGMQVRKTATHSSGVVLSDSSVTPAQMTTTANAAIVFPYASAQSTTTKDLNGTAIGTSTITVPANGYDSYGNLLSSTATLVSGSDTFTTSATNLFDNLTTNWQIGLMRQSTMSKSSPGVSSITRVATADYDSYGAVMRTTIQPNDITLKVVTEFTLDGFGNVTKTTLKWTDPATSSAMQKDTSTLTMDAKGRFPLTISNALSQSETRTYSDAYGATLTQTGPNLLTTTWQYDGFGRKQSALYPDGTSSAWNYRRCVDTCNGAATVVVAQSLLGTTQYDTPSEKFIDRIGRDIQSRDWGFGGTAVYTQRQFDASGRLQQRSRPFAAGATPVWTSFLYDDLGRATTVTEPTATGSTQQSTVAYNGLTTVTTNAKSQTRTEVRNGIGKIKQVLDANSQSTSYLYDAFGNTLRITDPLGNQINVAYDGMGRRTSIADPDQGSTSFLLDPLGQVYSRTNARNQTITYAFDALGRMTRRTAPDLDSRWVFDTAAHGIGGVAEAYTLRGDGGKDYDKKWLYDGLGRAYNSTLTLDQDYTATSTYDPYGRIAGTAYVRNGIGGSGGPGNTVEYGYNGYGFRSQVRTSTAAGALLAQNIVNEDAEGRVTRRQAANGLYTDRNYNAYVGTLDGLTTGADNGSGGDTATIQNDSYQYDALQNLTYRTMLASTGGTLVQETFGYDALNRLTSSQVGGQSLKSMTYDALGNVQSRTGVGTYAYPASGAGSVRPHAVSGITGTTAGLTNPTFAYDADGNTSSGLGRTYTWTSFDLPATIARTNAVNSSSVSATFVYGPDYQRAKQTLSNGTTLVYAGSIEKETTAAGTRIKTYLPDGIGYVEETTANPVPTVRFFHADPLGSVAVITDQSGAVLDRMDYDPWGVRRNTNGTDDSTYALKGAQDRTGFTGQEELEELDLVHLNGRVYDPLIGRFTSADPTVPDGYGGQHYNRYSYVLNNPLNYTDPTGYTPLNGWKVTLKYMLRPGEGWYADVAAEERARGFDAMNRDEPKSPSASGFGIIEDTPDPGVQRLPTVQTIFHCDEECVAAKAMVAAVYQAVQDMDALARTLPRMSTLSAALVKPGRSPIRIFIVCLIVGCGNKQSNSDAEEYTKNDFYDTNGDRSRGREREGRDREGRDGKPLLDEGAKPENATGNDVKTPSTGSEGKKDDVNLEQTPTTHPENFTPVKGTKGKKNSETGEIWVKDTLHKDHYEVYKNKKDFDKRTRDRDVWADGRSKRNF